MVIPIDLCSWVTAKLSGRVRPVHPPGQARPAARSAQRDQPVQDDGDGGVAAAPAARGSVMRLMRRCYFFTNSTSKARSTSSPANWLRTTLVTPKSERLIRVGPEKPSRVPSGHDAGADAVEGDVQGHRLGHAMEGQVAGHRPLAVGAATAGRSRRR